jgi:hypothetical protein
LRPKPGDPDVLVAATYGRGVYTFRFQGDSGRCAPRAGAPTGGGGGAAVCAAGKGFKSAKVTPRGRGLRFTVTPGDATSYTADVYHSATTKRTLHARRVARLGTRKGSFTWKGSKRLKSGYYFAQVRARGGKASDIRRFPVFLSRGRFKRLRDYYGRATCNLLGIARLSAPTFGGRTRTSLGIRLYPRQTGRATITVKRGKKTIKRFKVTLNGGAKILRKVRAKHLARGNYVVTVVATSGRTRQTAKLVSKRI